MSELTRCNFCSLNFMRRQAEERGVELIVELSIEPPLAGWTSARYSDKPGPTAYFLQVPEECAC